MTLVVQVVYRVRGAISYPYLESYIYGLVYNHSTQFSANQISISDYYMGTHLLVGLTYYKTDTSCARRLTLSVKIGSQIYHIVR